MEAYIFSDHKNEANVSVTYMYMYVIPLQKIVRTDLLHCNGDPLTKTQNQGMELMPNKRQS